MDPTSTGPHVFVVEDEPDLRSMLKIVLQAHGYRVTDVGTARQALDLVAEHSPDLVILDMLLPDGNGLEVCRHMRSNPSQQHVPILMISAWAHPADVSACFAAGANDFLPKPFDLDALLSLIRILREPSQADHS